MATYSLSNPSGTGTSFRGAMASNPQQVINNPIDDTYVNTPQAERNAMMLGAPFLAKGPDGLQALYKYDAERSIPGVLRILVRV